MLIFRVEYLTGRAAATAYNDRDAAEWPPHPARLFSALVATYAENDVPDEAERNALLWLEQADAPGIAAPDATERKAVTHFVPVNDPRLPARTSTKGAVKSALGLLPEHRVRQPRTFPSVTPDPPVAFFVYDEEPTPALRSALGRVASRLVSLGHSSSLVSVSLATDAPDPLWIPDAEGTEVLRVPAPGQLSRLEEDWKIHGGVEPRVLPCRFVKYRAGRKQTARTLARSPFGEDWIVFRRLGGPRLPLTRTADVAAALRAALLLYGEDPPPEILSGHDEDGSPVSRLHAAFVPLPFVAHRHADGSILGVAVVLPREADESERRRVFAAIGRFEAAHRLEDEEAPVIPLLLGRTGRLELERVTYGPPPLASLRPSTWSRPSPLWATATPLALDRNPGDLYSADPSKAEAAFSKGEEILRQSCLNAGLPEPSEVVLLPSVTLPGTRKARHFPPFPPERQKLRRVLVHARIGFDAPVAGPLLLGAGRYLGLGLFRPIDEGPDLG
jgi:CRISPR-associated protein Csb2